MPVPFSVCCGVTRRRLGDRPAPSPPDCATSRSGSRSDGHLPPLAACDSPCVVLCPPPRPDVSQYGTCRRRFNYMKEREYGEERVTTEGVPDNANVGECSNHR